jgi:UDP-N-acetylmuramate--alanine ligase
MTRSLEEISRGLEPSRPGRPIPPAERIHVLGVGGAAASASVLLAAASGAQLSGCDAAGASLYTPAVIAAGIPLEWRHDPGHVVGPAGPVVDRIAVSKALTSVDPDLPELVAARTAGIPAISCQQLIADAAATRGARVIAVSGTHGKSTTTGWLVHMLLAAGEDPSAFVGALMPASLSGGEPSVVRLGEEPVLIVEADEYGGNFDPYHPAIGVVLNADWDHPDVFASRADVVATFEGWIRTFHGDGQPPTLVANAEDPGIKELLPRLRDWPGRLLLTSIVEGRDDPDGLRSVLAHEYSTSLGPAEAMVASMLIEEKGNPTLTISGLDRAGGALPSVTLRLIGRHNASNALAAAAAGLAHGATGEAILKSLGSFEGVGRRLELKGEIRGVAVLDDFGHHPTAIAATIAAVRLRYPGRRLWAVYEPLTFHRTAAMLDQFADVLATKAERVAIADIFAVRDPDTSIVSAADLARAINLRNGARAVAPGSVESTADYLASEVLAGDVVLVTGGGRSYVIAERLVEALRARGADPA